MPIEETETEIRARIIEPEKFEANSFSRITIKEDKPRIYAIIGKIIGESSTTIQAYRFPKEDGWTIESARKWVNEHKETKKMANKITTEFTFKEWLDSNPNNKSIIERIERKGSDINLDSAKYIRKTFNTGVKRISDDDGSIIHYITVEKSDRDKELIKISGMMLDFFEGAVFFNHDYYLPMGKNMWLKPENENASKTMGMLARTQLVGGDEFSNRIKHLYTCDIEGTGPVLKSWSIGIIPMTYRAPSESEKKAYGNDIVRIYDTSELMEYSAVSIGSNRQALSVAIGKGIVSSRDAIKMLMAEYDDVEQIKDVLAVANKGQVSMSIPNNPSTESANDIESETKAIGGAKVKAVDDAGNPSAKDIKESIEAKMNKPINGPYAMAQFKYYVEDLYPINYPDGHFIVEIYNTVSGSTDEYWRYEYRYNGGDPEIMGGIKMQETYKPKQDLANMERAISSISVATKAGAVLSASNRERVQRFRDAASQAVSTADELLSIANPDKEKKSLDNDEGNRVKIVSVADELKKAFGNGLIRETVKEELARATGRIS